MFLQVVLTMIRQVIGMAVLASFYIFVMPLSKCIGRNILLGTYDRQSNCPENNNVIFVDLFSKVSNVSSQGSRMIKINIEVV